VLQLMEARQGTPPVFQHFWHPSRQASRHIYFDERKDLNYFVFTVRDAEYVRTLPKNESRHDSTKLQFRSTFSTAGTCDTSTILALKLCLGPQDRVVYDLGSFNSVAN
jgi:hypothetical protein